MEDAELIILDVGHGNCTIIRDSGGVIVVDCPRGVELPDTLSQLGITEISHVLISHADQDHIAGLPNLLLNKDLRVANVHINSDWLRNTKIWEAVRCSLADARITSSVNVEAQLTTSTTCRLNIGRLNIKVLAPVPELALTGVGGKDSEGNIVRANSMSAVISIGCGTTTSTLLMGDLDQVGLNHLLSESVDLRADVLVFPHHGGKPGAGVDSKAFSRHLCGIVMPELVVFSIDRNLHKNPNDEIVQGIVEAVPETHIMCTQLSEKCTASLPSSHPSHVNNLPAKGHADKKCCGGTILIRITEEGSTYIPPLNSHKNFVSQYLNSVCQKYS